ncbi:uncharacterized protein THITE_2107484 [Thermothielavioides terrestris NRRL 8126]|uniref:Uncharacterized protein n=1 Tax=Thermothielavioides terrestris (strain ATCC 38088 / NRRL 8126) TaxID=578455 RepID=G2QU69_THETT|nr:uncharacterized protein THITE_2107484 [Thermothielavioides terrestris NRRL 8126]AEO62821.1 hypothetical protein THITE_2107484 [Thermothielavioides terrestris NRRL 8126]
MAGAGPPVPRIYRFTATGLGAIMWFWVGYCCSVAGSQHWSRAAANRGTMNAQIFYRAKKDGPVLLGWKHPWDH